MTRRRVLASAIGLAAARPGRAEPTFAAAGWRVVGVPGRAMARFSPGADGTIAVEAEGAVAFLVRAVLPAELPAGGWRLAWRWRVEAAPPATDPAVAGADDRPAAVHLLFPSPEGGVRRWLRGRVLGQEFSGRALTYVWGGTAAAGTMLRSPQLGEDGALVVRRGQAAPWSVWQEEIVDAAQDHERAFRAPAPVPSHLALSADTDDRGGVARASFAAPRFVPA